MATITRTDPAQARATESKVRDGLDAGDQSRLAQDLHTLAERTVRADRQLAAAGPVSTRPLSGQQVTATSDRLLKEATAEIVNRAVDPGHDRVDIPELAYSVQALAGRDATLARAVRADLATRLSPEDAADLDRVLARDTHFGEGIGAALRHPVDGAIGAAKGLGTAA